MAEPEVSEEVIELLVQLLARHYTEGDVPMPIVEVVEEALKKVGRWFDDPQYFYHPEIGYV